MQISQDNTRSNPWGSTVAAGVLGGAVGAGFNYYHQKGALGSDEKLGQLKNDLVILEHKAQEAKNEKGISGFFSKISSFLDKKEIWTKKDMIESISTKQISKTAIGKSALFWGIDVAMGYLFVDSILKSFQRKKD